MDMRTTTAASAPSFFAEVASLRFLLTTASVLLLACLSDSALVYLGVDYVLPGGNPLEKIHPGTWLALMSICLLAVTGSFEKLRRAAFIETPEILYFFISCIALSAFTVAFKSVPFSATIDTFFSAGFICLLIATLDAKQNWMLRRIIDGFMLFNSLLGMVEAGTNWRFIPFSVASMVLGQILYPYEWRASALLGHPLTNSYVTGAYALSLLVTNRIPNIWLRLGLFLLHTMALFAFGSRAGAAFLGVAAVLYLGWHLTQALMTGWIKRSVGLYLMAFVPIVLVGAPLVLASGFADRFLNRFVVDNGSAETRSYALDMVSSYSIGDLIFGPSGMEIAQMAQHYGTQFGIENFWLSFMLRFGVIGCVLFFPGLYLFCRGMYRRTNSGVAIVLVYFFACCTTSVSIASKSLSFMLVTAICMTCAYRPYVGVPAPSPTPVPAPSRGSRGPRTASAGA